MMPYGISSQMSYIFKYFKTGLEGFCVQMNDSAQEQDVITRSPGPLIR